MDLLLPDFRLQREIDRHFVLGDKPCQLFLPPSFSSYLHNFYTAISFKLSGIQMKINAGPRDSVEKTSKLGLNALNRFLRYKI